MATQQKQDAKSTHEHAYHQNQLAEAPQLFGHPQVEAHSREGGDASEQQFQKGQRFVNV